MLINNHQYPIELCCVHYDGGEVGDEKRDLGIDKIT